MHFLLKILVNRKNIVKCLIMLTIFCLYTAIVYAYDKSEFSELKNEYNTNNNREIDGAISNFLGGIEIITPEMEKVVHINNEDKFTVNAGTKQLLGKSDKTLSWNGNNIITMENLKYEFINLVYPVGSRYIQIEGMPEPSTYGGTWTIDENYDGKALWCDNSISLGTQISQALPKPKVTFSGLKVEINDSVAHSHDFSTTNYTDYSGTHNHTFTGTEVNTNTEVYTSGGTTHSHSITAGGAWKQGDSPSKVSYRDNGTRVYNTEQAGNHSHTVEPKGTIVDANQHTHKLVPQGTISDDYHYHTYDSSGSVRCDTSGAYGAGTVVQPPAITCKVWKRTA